MQLVILSEWKLTVNIRKNLYVNKKKYPRVPHCLSLCNAFTVVFFITFYEFKDQFIVVRVM